MAATVDEAFDEFLKNTVNLDKDQTAKARTSRDNLMQHITDFSKDDDFFDVYSERNLKFGSFARRTKIRPLDDIDLMICLSASNDGESRTYDEYEGCYYINGIGFDIKNGLTDENSEFLNSTKVINRFISKLSEIADYKKAEMHKNHEAATLQLKSYTWNFDIVPCFHTDGGFYLIPDGKGAWKKTDPRIDNDRITDINQQHNGSLLPVIRLVKYWNQRQVTTRIGSYLLESMILSIYEYQNTKERYWVDYELRNTLEALSSSILNAVPDPKGMQDDLNTFDSEERDKIAAALYKAYEKADEAEDLEFKDPKAAINKWREILGPEFPKYTED